jgi:hypothetical protein
MAAAGGQRGGRGGGEAGAGWGWLGRLAAAHDWARPGTAPHKRRGQAMVKPRRSNPVKPRTADADHVDRVVERLHVAEVHRVLGHLVLPLLGVLNLIFERGC